MKLIVKITNQTLPSLYVKTINYTLRFVDCNLATILYFYRWYDLVKQIPLNLILLNQCIIPVVFVSLLCTMVSTQNMQIECYIFL